MNPVKMLGLAMVSAMALVALVGSGTASAGGVLCEVQESKCPNGSKWAVNKLLDFSLEAGTSAKVINTEGTTTYNTCGASTFETEITENPKAEGGEVTGRTAALTWGNGVTPCTVEMNTIEPGHVKIANIGGTFNGTVRVDEEIQVTILSALGKCVYGIKVGTDIGELKEGKVAMGSTPPTLAINAVAVKKIITGDPCSVMMPQDVRFVASYELTTPANTTLAVTEE